MPCLPLRNVAWNKDSLRGASGPSDEEVVVDLMLNLLVPLPLLREAPTRTAS